jgi:hypothetical protein
MVVKFIYFLDVTPCGLVSVRHFGGKYCLHLQGRSVSHASNRGKMLGTKHELDKTTCESGM